MFWRHYVGRPREESSSSRTAASVEKKPAISRASLRDLRAAGRSSSESTRRSATIITGVRLTVGSWNMGRTSRGWAYLDSLDVDVALVQEAALPSTPRAAEWTSIPTIGDRDRWSAGSKQRGAAIVASYGPDLEEVPGDFNITPQWKDHPRYGQWGVHHELCLARLTAFGFEDCVARFHDKYQPTLWKGNLPPYQNDWMFARGITPVECRVLNAETERTKTPGNHSPIIATFVV